MIKKINFEEGEVSSVPSSDKNIEMSDVELIKDSDYCLEESNRYLKENGEHVLFINTKVNIGEYLEIANTYNNCFYGTDEGALESLVLKAFKFNKEEFFSSLKEEIASFIYKNKDNYYEYFLNIDDNLNKLSLDFINNTLDLNIANSFLTKQLVMDNFNFKDEIVPYIILSFEFNGTSIPNMAKEIVELNKKTEKDKSNKK